MTADFAKGMMAAEQIVSDEAERVWKMRDLITDPQEKLNISYQSQAVAKAAQLIRNDVKSRLDEITP